jgi:hypothetical protein
VRVARVTCSACQRPRSRKQIVALAQALTNSPVTRATLTLPVHAHRWRQRGGGDDPAPRPCSARPLRCCSASGATHGNAPFSTQRVPEQDGYGEHPKRAGKRAPVRPRKPERGLRSGRVTRDTANLAAPERVRQFACASEGAAKLSSGAGDPPAPRRTTPQKRGQEATGTGSPHETLRPRRNTVSSGKERPLPLVRRRPSSVRLLLGGRG